MEQIKDKGIIGTLCQISLFLLITISSKATCILKCVNFKVDTDKRSWKFTCHGDYNVNPKYQYIIEYLVDTSELL